MNCVVCGDFLFFLIIGSCCSLFLLTNWLVSTGRSMWSPETLWTMILRREFQLKPPSSTAEFITMAAWLARLIGCWYVQSQLPYLSQATRVFLFYFTCKHRLFDVNFLLPQSPPNHVIPHPEEIYIYSPLGTAFKVCGSDGAAKNPSIITM